VKKFDALIANFLYSNKTVDIEGLGNFSLDEHFVLPPDAEKTAFYPLEGIRFQYNPRTATTPALLDHIVQQTGKIRSLIVSDFDSYITEIRQFVNIGKPWVIDGIGTLQKNKEGQFELVPGQVVSERINVHYTDENEESSATPVKRNRWIVGLLFVVAIAAVVAGLGFGIYAVFFQGKSNTPEQVVTINADTPRQVPAEDTVSRKPDTIPVNTSVSIDTSYNFKAYFETTKWKDRVEKRTTQLTQLGIATHYDSLVIKDTLRYRLFVYQRVIPPDSVRIIRVRDSLSAYFGRKVRMEKIR